MSKPRVRRQAAREKRLLSGKEAYLEQERALVGMYDQCELCGSRGCSKHALEHGVALCMEVEVEGW